MKKWAIVKFLAYNENGQNIGSHKSLLIKKKRNIKKMLIKKSQKRGCE